LSYLSKENILSIYSRENRYFKREKVREKGSAEWRDKKAVRVCLVLILINPVLIPVILTNTRWY
jgi:hypothetical protein